MELHGTQTTKTAFLRPTPVMGYPRSSVNVILQGTLFKPELDGDYFIALPCGQYQKHCPSFYTQLLSKYCVCSLLSTYFLAVSCSCCSAYGIYVCIT